MIGIGLLQDFIGLDGTVEVFMIPPAGDGHDWHSHLLELINQRLLLPELIIVRMRHEVVPGRYFSMKVFRVGVRKRTQPQIPLIGIGSIKFEVSGQI